jgi:hypothetical protein
MDGNATLDITISQSCDGEVSPSADRSIKPLRLRIKLFLIRRDRVRAVCRQQHQVTTLCSTLSGSRSVFARDDTST